MSDVKLSLIVPAYNEAAILGPALDAIVAQMRAVAMGVELIVVDDCSSDDTYERLKAYEDVAKILRMPKNSGGAGAPRNLGLDAASGTFVTFYDMGDILDLTIAEQAIAQMEPRGLNLAVCKHMNVGPKGEFVPVLAELFEQGDALTDFRTSPLLIHNPFAWSKIYRRSWLNEKSIRFGTQYCGEDKIFTWKAYLEAGDIFLCSQIMYGHKFFGPDVNRMLQRNLALVRSVIEIDAQMRPVFEATEFRDLYNYRLLNRDLCGILLEDNSLAALSKRGELDAAMGELRTWLRALVASGQIDPATMMVPENIALFEKHFPELMQGKAASAQPVAGHWAGRRVALVDPGLVNKIGHHEDVDLKIARALVAQGASVTVFAHKDYPASSHDGIAFAPHFATYPYHSYWLGSTAAKEIRQFDELSSGFGEELAPILASHDALVFPSMFPYQLFALAGLDPDVDVFGIVHNSPTNPRFDGYATWTLAIDALRHMRRIPQIGLVEDMLHHEFDGLFRHADPLHILPYPVLENPALHRSDALKTIGLFGAHRHEQGLSQMGAVMNTILREGLEVVIHDAGNKINVNGQRGIRKIGHVANLSEAISACDAIIINYDIDYYRHMGSGLSWDALSVGVPVLCSRGIAPSKMLQHYSACLLFSNNDMDSLAAALKRAKADYPALLSQVHAGRARMLAGHGTDRLVARMGEILALRAASSR